MLNNCFASITTLRNIDLSLPTFAPATEARIPKMYEPLDIFHVRVLIHLNPKLPLIYQFAYLNYVANLPNYTV